MARHESPAFGTLLRLKKKRGILAHMLPYPVTLSPKGTTSVRLARAPDASNDSNQLSRVDGYQPSKSSTSLAAEAEPVAWRSVLAAFSVAITPLGAGAGAAFATAMGAVATLVAFLA